ncbi:MAG: glycosyltransferase family 4 protein [Candidatus Omnitrophota bacterium]
MKVCYWGTYDKDYPRNRIIILGLTNNGVEVTECHSQIWLNTKEKVARASSRWLDISLLLRMSWVYTKLSWKFLFSSRSDFMIVGYSGHFDVFIAKALSKIKNIPLVFDAFLSLYDSLVLDRKVVKKGTFKSRILRWVDKYACKLADLVILDTNAHIDYFCTEYNLPREKFKRIFIGADDSIFRPCQVASDSRPFTVLFHGKYIPLHGLPYIIQAAKELEEEEVYFKIIGSGDEYDSIVKLAEELKVKNIEFVDFMPPVELAEEIRRADICLGIFGNTAKAKRVIPNKVYECMAMRKPVVTGDSPASRELLIDRENSLLCAMGQYLPLAKAIRQLKQDVNLRTKIAKNGYELYQNNFSLRVLGSQLKDILQEQFQ